MKTKRSRALYLVKDKGRQSIFKMLFSRIGIMVLLIFLQVLFFIGVFSWFSDLSPQLYGLSVIFSYLIGLYIVNNQMNYTAKLTWLAVIIAVPIFGAALYAYTQSNIGHRLLVKRINLLIARTEHLLFQQPEVIESLKQEDEGVASLARYLQLNGNYPVYNQSETIYFPSGKDKLDTLLYELEKAEKFIFLEYFIIQEGEMWGRVLDVLARKANEGVEVRIMYDGTCAFTKVPIDYEDRIRALGIQCKTFAPITPFLSTHYNYRDHRKILVIDGHTAFNGGINFADEYININSSFGHWKDTAVMIKGDAVKSYTLMFLQLWSINEPEFNFEPYLVSYPSQKKKQGFVIPYADEPLDDDKVGESVYIDILNRATDYVYIMTPYLILDGEMENALKFAAKRGIDVKIILPGIPDKKVPYAIAKTHYDSLLSAGVDIYEYTPGFIHAKMFISDDTTAVVGTINLDYRSLYHHFECATYLYKVPCIRDIKQDFEETIRQSELILYNHLRKIPLKERITGWLLKIFAPLM
ncbi:cardiolipin synthase [Tuanshanicoccus lijuaniae]|uniref:cardiolipin synthase n=1 Tax=Aerococcaceae bacterium zg-1292 TaxID=2774330 RepID=UPI001BD85AC7|nr:cardiolipin synthase [Aerococcaceae bacterium zg-A91]MBS4457632.1 cardiolipin synthase [Aerococcaceae bacterium zg-BR33]